MKDDVFFRLSVVVEMVLCAKMRSLEGSSD